MVQPAQIWSRSHSRHLKQNQLSINHSKTFLVDTVSLPRPKVLQPSRTFSSLSLFSSFQTPNSCYINTVSSILILCPVHHPVSPSESLTRARTDWLRFDSLTFHQRSVGSLQQPVQHSLPLQFRPALYNQSYPYPGSFCRDEGWKVRLGPAGSIQRVAPAPPGPSP